MSSCLSVGTRKALLIAAGVLGASLALAQSSAYPGIGRAATPKELAAWDTDVRPDFKGLPKGQGSVAKGQEVWEAQCASCHGIFGESNQVFSPLVGGTTPADTRGRSWPDGIPQDKDSGRALSHWELPAVSWKCIPRKERGLDSNPAPPGTTKSFPRCGAADLRPKSHT